MAKKQKSEQIEISEEVKQDIISVSLLALALFFLLSIFDLAGKVGNFFYEKFYYLFGFGYIILPIFLLFISFLKAKLNKFKLTKILSSIAFLLSLLGIISIITGPENSYGGLLGDLVSEAFVRLFDNYISLIFLAGIFVISTLVIFDINLNTFKNAWLAFKNGVKNLAKIFKNKKNTETGIHEQKLEEKIKDYNHDNNLNEGSLGVPPPSVGGTPSRKTKADIKGEANKAEKHEQESEEILINKNSKRRTSSYTPPPLSIIEEDQGKPNTGDIKGNANTIKRTLENFGIDVEMDEITIGPTVTRYALKPAEGIKLSRIVALQNDLALALAAHPIRIEAPIPGRSLVGIEIPNRSKATVGLATMLADNMFQNSPHQLTIALGRSISGKAAFGNLAKMPHCLVAGTTGAGKSVAIHTMITSLLFKNSPSDLKLIMVDPKRVELTLYKNLPHLLTPVITEPKKAILALRWAAKEMDRRYDILEKESARDIDSYNNKIINKENKAENKENKEKKEELENLPYIVIIIDELADIMTAYPRELEAAIVRLAQMSRAIGIHLILSTQRPEVNVITGLIKANIPARIALKVASQVDSRTILDAGGAEKLLGAGDMLYSSGTAQPERLQSAFITENEVKKVVKYLIDAYQDELPQEICLTNENVLVEKDIFKSELDNNNNIEETGEDPMYEEARKCVLETGKASTSYLQRKLKLGYARAARLMDMLEERGIVSPGEGAKKREVLGQSEDKNEEQEESL